MTKKFYYFKTKHISLQKTREARIENTHKIHENFRNYASSPYWRFAQGPYRDVFEIGGSTCKKM